jgi:hypothetical protein
VRKPPSRPSPKGGKEEDRGVYRRSVSMTGLPGHISDAIRGKNLSRKPAAGPYAQRDNKLPTHPPANKSERPP